MHRLLKQIKKGSYANVAEVKDNRLCMIQLRYNPVRHKFFLSEDKRGLMRRSITGRQAERLIFQTLFISNPKAYDVKEGDGSTT